MHRPFRLFVGLLLLLGLAVGALHLPEALADRDFLRVRGVQVEGTGRLDPGEVVEAMAVPPDLSIMDDPAPLEERLRGHPLVREAEVTRRPSLTLLARVEEREPLALLPTPTLVPVDGDGRTLPLDPVSEGLDLPVVRIAGWENPSMEDRDDLPPAGRLTAELERVAERAPGLVDAVSEVGWAEGGALTARLEDPPVTFHLPEGVDERRLGEGLEAFRDAAARGDTIPHVVDLRFEDQVVVRYPIEEGG